MDYGDPVHADDRAALDKRPQAFASTEGINLSNPVSIGRCLPMYVEQADQIIIEGEKRIGRLVLLAGAMADEGYGTGRIEILMAKQAKLLDVWDERRSLMIKRFETEAGTSGFQTE